METVKEDEDSEESTGEVTALPNSSVFGRTFDLRGVKLVPYQRVEWCLLSPALLALFLLVIALSVDELYSGEMKFLGDSSYSSIKWTKYRCGWQMQMITERRRGGEERESTIDYDSDKCRDDYDKGDCKSLAAHGSAFVGLNITAILFTFIAALAVYKQGKRSLIYLIGLTIALILSFAACIDYVANEKCTDLNEATEDNHADVEVTTDLGASLVVALVAVGIIFISLFFSVIVNFFPQWDPRRRNQRQQRMLES